MELPITVMVVLFVSLAVGGVIIVFSNNVLQNAEDGMPNLGEDKLQDKIIEVPSVSKDMVTSLAEQCIEDHKERIDEVLCVVVDSDIPIGLSSTDFTAPIDGTGLDQDKYTIYIYYYGHSNLAKLKS